MNYATKELSKRTFPDFVRLFSQGNGWDHCGCIAYQGFRPPRDVRKWADMRDRALEVKRDLVGRGRAHGILVYDGTEPIGWCQFGPEGELPIRDDRRTSKLFPAGSDPRLWRITCFVTHKRYQHQGVAGVALRAALEAIRKKGGGLVEAHPLAHADADPTPEGRPYLVEVVVRGVGPVSALCRWWSPALHVGTVSMFEKEGFKAVKALADPPRRRSDVPHPTRILMQRTV